VCFLKGSMSLLWWFVCNLFLLLSGFWGLDVALGLRANQYKLFVYLFFPLNSFRFSCYCFAGINNQLFLINHRLFFWCFAVLCFISWLTEFLIEFHTKDFVLAEKVFKKKPFKQFTPSRLRPYILTCLSPTLGRKWWCFGNPNSSLKDISNFPI